MIIYSFRDSEEYGNHFTSLRSAIKAAREQLDEDWYSEEIIEISRHVVVPLNKENFCNILNTHGGRFSANSKIIKTLRKSAKRETTDANERT